LPGPFPAYWIRHAGPNRWYALWHPPTWEVREENGTESFSAPSAAGILTISSFWLEDCESKVGKVIDLDRLFPQRRGVRSLQPADIGQEIVGYEGESPLSPGRWWQKLLHRSVWRKWRVWCIRHGDVYVLALYLQNGDYDREAETLSSMILGTLAFSPQPVCPPEVFARRVLELARRNFPELPCEPVADFQLMLGKSELNLFNLYRSYLNSPGQFEEILLPALTTMVEMQERGRQQLNPAFDDVRERIMPMLYPQDIWNERFPNFIGEPWVGGLVILYVVDEPEAYWYIRQDLLDHWGLSTDDLHDLALQNLDRYFELQPMEFTLAGNLTEDDTGARLLVPIRPDAYNTVHLLSPDFRNQVRETMGPEYIVGAPTRDFFVAVSLELPDAVEHVRRKVEEDFRQMDYPLTEQLLFVTHDGVTEYAPWDEGEA